jgi:hypothetical protein
MDSDENLIVGRDGLGDFLALENIGGTIGVIDHGFHR